MKIFVSLVVGAMVGYLHSLSPSTAVGVIAYILVLYTMPGPGGRVPSSGSPK